MNGQSVQPNPRKEKEEKIRYVGPISAEERALNSLPAIWHCEKCGLDYHPKPGKSWACPNCDSE